MQDLRKTLLATYSPRELENAKAYGLSTFTEKIRDKMVSFVSTVFIARILGNID